MTSAAGHVNVERIGDVIVARVSGEPTEELIRSCHGEVLKLLGGERSAKVLYDALDMVAPVVDVPWAQRALDEAMVEVKWRRAIVVPNTRLAFLARLAFGDGDYRVFYDDLAAALRWLGSDDPPGLA
jgi:stage II sporulation SpoAA-like protein